MVASCARILADRRELVGRNGALRRDRLRDVRALHARGVAQVPRQNANVGKASELRVETAGVRQHCGPDLLRGRRKLRQRHEQVLARVGVARGLLLLDRGLGLAAVAVRLLDRALRLGEQRGLGGKFLRAQVVERRADFLDRDAAPTSISLSTSPPPDRRLRRVVGREPLHQDLVDAGDQVVRRGVLPVHRAGVAIARDGVVGRAAERKGEDRRHHQEGHRDASDDRFESRKFRHFSRPSMEPGAIVPR